MTKISIPLLCRLRFSLMDVAVAGVYECWDFSAQYERVGAFSFTPVGTTQPKYVNIAIEGKLFCRPFRAKVREELKTK